MSIEIKELTPKQGEWAQGVIKAQIQTLCYELMEHGVDSLSVKVFPAFTDDYMEINVKMVKEADNE